MNRLTFLSHFVICLAVAAAAFFAGQAGMFATVWANDASRMTSVIGALFIGTSAWLGVKAWQAGGEVWKAPSGELFMMPGYEKGRLDKVPLPDASFGHLAERLLPMLGLFGTAFGLSLQAKALSGGATSFVALATSLYCTAAGVLGALIVALMTYSLERGIARARR